MVRLINQSKQTPIGVEHAGVNNIWRIARGFQYPKILDSIDAATKR